MSGAVEIKMTYRGFEVTARGHKRDFANLADAFSFAQQHMETVQQLSELARRCE